MKMKTPLSPASRRPLLKHFEQTVAVTVTGNPLRQFDPTRGT